MDEWIDGFIHAQLHELSPGLSDGSTELLGDVIVACLVALLALVGNYIAKRVILQVVKRVIAKTEITWDDVLVENHVFDRLSHLAPALVFYALAGAIFPSVDGLKGGLRQGAIAYMIIIVASAVHAFLTSVVTIYDSFEVAKSRPIKSYVQLVKVVVFMITAILVVSTLTERSPWGFLSGLAGLTAVIMLVFKDSILGLVGSIQLTAYKMVAVGDWIEVPKYGVDGDVVDISLNTIKVQNWDKTISTFPTYALMSETFKNWRGMTDSGGRRIKRALKLDMNSVRFVEGELLTRLQEIELLKDYLASKKRELDADAKARGVSPDHPVNARRMTNLGTFRIYVVNYLRSHAKIHNDMTFLVRHLPPGPDGIGLEVYVFSNDQVWGNYENIQADIFEHLLAILPVFELRVFQNPSGADLRMIGQASKTS